MLSLYTQVNDIGHNEPFSIEGNATEIIFEAGKACHMFIVQMNYVKCYHFENICLTHQITKLGNSYAIIIS
jgi:hypothetical protein